MQKQKVQIDWDQFVNTEEIVTFIQSLIQTPSENPTGDTREIAEVVQRKCLEIGLETRIVSKDGIRANVVATLEGNKPGPTLLFNGHIDTVPAGDLSDWDYDPFGGVIEEGRLYGRGAADMLGGTGTMIMAAQLIKKAGIDIAGKVIFTAVADEETGGALGTGYLLEQGLTADAAICTEPSELDIHLAHKGAYWFRITTKGVTSHGSVPEQGVNAVEKMAKIIANMNRLQLSHTPHKLLTGPTIAPGTLIEGGTKTNVVPSHCSATFDIRTVPGMKHEQVRREIQEFLDNLSIEDPDIQAEFEDLFWMNAAEIDESEKIVQVTKSAVERITGRQPQISANPGTADARLIAAYGIPIIPFFGPGTIDQAHKRNEYVEVNQLIDATKIYADIIFNYLGSNSG
ncbi:M20 family metallopeptidase [Siminovitchia sediminis]|uniref:Probable succinyl-diaminopimelate desuccinylase n=1 Tax=Siminovitchia sediminis TaxID=1274353 RepID=A0ABW4KM40_9BACI